MGEMAQKITKTDLNELIRTLNEAYAEEWLAYYQYWLGAKVAAGQMRTSIVEEFEEHAKEELEHADMLAERIIQLGGTPVLNPDDWSKLAKCKYDCRCNNGMLRPLSQHPISHCHNCCICRYTSRQCNRCKCRNNV